MIATRLLAWAMAAGVLPAMAADDPVGRAPFTDRRNPPPWTQIHPATRKAYDLGHAVFNTSWVPAGQENAGRRDGLGPLFVSDRCDGCHNNGARGRPPAAPGQLSNSFVMQLANAEESYGHVLDTQAIEGHEREGYIVVTWATRTGHHADGTAWAINEPRYAIEDLRYGPLPRSTVLKPRIGPAVFGAGLLDAVPAAAVQALREAQPRRLRGQIGGRFGWQGEALTLPDQTARAFAREMGLGSDLIIEADCAPAQQACRESPGGGTPEVSAELFDAVIAFQMLLAVPERPAGIDAARDAAGAALFRRIGCAGCHVPQLPLPLATGGMARIEPYTDLLLHDLGTGLADRDLAGRPVRSLWRTAPLWGLAHALGGEGIALLHDGRARSLEEAILWHDGQARSARQAFGRLDGGERELLLEWLATL